MGDIKTKSIDIAAQEILKIAKDENIKTAWDRLESQQPQCGFGQLGLCCTVCDMGPCRIDPFGEGPQKGVCGAGADTIAARNLGRKIAVGASAHSDHGRDVAHVLSLAAESRSQGHDHQPEGSGLASFSQSHQPE
ncbi:MAG: carbon monoxide dehydrogenase, partial [Candidatus Omnitrophota bacterium]|nr:carbon monoxide dehydrogenase [Candidatus Omnitrophota bacterium]